MMPYLSMNYNKHIIQLEYYDKGCIKNTSPCDAFKFFLDAEKKKVKKRWSFITRIFHRASVPQHDQVCTSLPVTKRGKLFGNDLAIICEDGNLPKAILVSHVSSLAILKTKSGFLNIAVHFYQHEGEAVMYQILDLKIGREDSAIHHNQSMAKVNFKAISLL